MMCTTVKPVLSGTVFSGYPLLSGDVANSQKFHNINTIKVTLIERSPQLRGRSHLFHGPNLNFSMHVISFQNNSIFYYS